MVILFWFFTAVLVSLGIGLLIPWLKPNKTNSFIFLLLITSSYSLYFFLGNSQHIKHYYMPEQYAIRKQQARMQPLWTELKKQEYRLRAHLDKHPKDFMARSQLLELLGIQALQAGDKDSAKAFIKQSLDSLSVIITVTNVTQKNVTKKSERLEHSEDLKQYPKATIDARNRHLLRLLQEF